MDIKNWTKGRKEQALEILKACKFDDLEAAKRCSKLWKKSVKAYELLGELFPQEPSKYKDVVTLEQETKPIVIPATPPALYVPPRTRKVIAAAVPTSTTSVVYTPTASLASFEPLPVAKDSTPSVSKIVVIPDWHLPRADPKTMSAMLGFITWYKPEYIVILGDFGDFESVSSFDAKDPQWGQIDKDFYAVNQGLESIILASPYSKLIYLQGNHEERLERAMNKDHRLKSFLDIEERLFIKITDKGYAAAAAIKPRNVLYVPLHKQPYYIGNHSAYIHGSGNSGAPLSRGIAQNFSASPQVAWRTTFFGHIHTFQSHTAKNGGRAVSCGFLGNEEALGYTNGVPTGWVNGFVVQEAYGDDMNFTFIQVRNNKIVFQGHVFEG